MGREFVELFNEWSDSYDDTVKGLDIEYRQVFENYNHILEVVADSVTGTVMEFGTGTGNLTEKLINRKCRVIGIEPSPLMRKKAEEKITGATIIDGDFLNFPTNEPIDAFVSTYAFHHLTELEKGQAIKKYKHILPDGGKVVFADTIFLTEKEKSDMIEKAEQDQLYNLADDLKTEYYTTLPQIKKMFEQNDFSIRFTQLNDFVWLLEAKK
ncbi:class I SAM-dependent methyltransferase [Virgibacillus sp. MSP4-1]|uniref:class I SAM-dependent DNA methyltransferase n=1 Tax=Virgibacillus sp. MSP4-1 TaxID=2700081 RepID=UPI0003A8D765|nr:class I SAM-dependent methyltransferase [Virgibacillus sp. MSP4-1]QHS22480.1 class I SAM-dependent methyltransferase [Virgibacillus sp. MSP4-1]